MYYGDYNKLAMASGPVQSNSDFDEALAYTLRCVQLKASISLSMSISVTFLLTITVGFTIDRKELERDWKQLEGKSIIIIIV